MATGKSNSKPKLAVVAPIAEPTGPRALDSEVYTLQGLIEGARVLIQWYRDVENANAVEDLPLLRAMRILEVAVERMDKLAARLDGLDKYEVAND